MKNYVIAGDYEGKEVEWTLKKVFIRYRGKKILLDKTTVANYELIQNESRKSAKSALTRGVVGAAVAGPIGAIAGSISAKNKETYMVSVEFKDGKKSMLEVDGEVYKELLKKLF